MELDVWDETAMDCKVWVKLDQLNNKRFELFPKVWNLAEKRLGGTVKIQSADVIKGQEDNLRIVFVRS